MVALVSHISNGDDGEILFPSRQVLGLEHRDHFLGTASSYWAQW